MSLSALGERMRQRKFAPLVGGAAAVLAALTCPSSEARAQSGSVQLVANFDQRFDCHRPFQVTNHPIRSEFKAMLRADKTATATLTMRGVISSNTVQFEARLGSGARSAPGGGTSQLRVMPGNRLRGIWDLPNNQIILDIAATGRTCKATVAIKLKPGHKEYSLYGGPRMYYCSKHTVLSSTCRSANE